MLAELTGAVVPETPSVEREKGVQKWLEGEESQILPRQKRLFLISSVPTRILRDSSIPDKQYGSV